jgi:3-oxoacyl-[acyl-carrier protein] reductase
MNTADIFRDKVVLVTGSSRGLGASLLKAFGQAGARCVVNYPPDPEGRNEAEARQTAALLTDPLLFDCDVGDAGQVNAMMAEIAAKLGGLDILINNAAILRDRTLKKMTTEEWESVLRVNLTGTFNCLRAAAGILRSGGRVVNISSVSGRLGFFGQANYSASKAGIEALTRVAARELASRRITVNAVAPGFLSSGLSGGLPEDVRRQFVAQIPLGRFGEIEEVVAAALFFCSPDARYLTGQVLHVDGGLYM